MCDGNCRGQSDAKMLINEDACGAPDPVIDPVKTNFDALGREWTDISSELYRTYTFVVDGSTCEVTINRPMRLLCSESGHRVLDSRGRGHYIPYGWVHLSWSGSPAFVA